MLNQAREELRGLFVLGVLASLLAGRENYKSVKIPFGTIEVDAIIFANLILLLWGMYAFFMALSISDDVLPDFIRPISEIFSSIALVFFMIGILFITYLGVFFFVIGNLTKLHIPLIPIIPLLLYETYKKRNYFNLLTNSHSEIDPGKVIRKISIGGFFVTYVIIVTSTFSKYNLALNHLPILIVMSFGFMLAYVIIIFENNARSE